MKAITKVLAGGVAMAALASAAPAAAQYYPGYGYGNGNILGQIINSVVGGGYNGYAPYGYNTNSQAVVNQCANAVQARLSGGYNGYNGYGYNQGYAYNGYANAGGRVLGISRVEARSSGGLTVRGVATSGRYAAYGYNQPQSQVDLVWKCRTDYRGMIIDLDIDPVQSNYGYNNGYNYNQYTPWNYDYSQYGYRRY